MALLQTSVMYPVSGNLCKYRLLSKCFHAEYSRWVDAYLPKTSSPSQTATTETRKKRKGKKRAHKNKSKGKGREEDDDDSESGEDASKTSSSSVAVSAVCGNDMDKAWSSVDASSRSQRQHPDRNGSTGSPTAKPRENSAEAASPSNNNNNNTDDEENGTCMICLDRPTRYGLLLGCNHAFCIGCIHSYRQNQRAAGLSGTWAPRNRDDPPLTDDVCPVCRTRSEIVIPHSRLVPNGPQKRELERAYRRQLKNRPCRHFVNSSEMFCPFGMDCFFSHRRADGTEAEFAHTLEDTRLRRIISTHNPWMHMMPQLLRSIGLDMDDDDDDDDDEGDSIYYDDHDFSQMF